MVYLRDRAGLLAARGEGVYTFPHRTFQEYLAACHLTDHGFPERAGRLAARRPGALAGGDAAGRGQGRRGAPPLLCGAWSKRCATRTRQRAQPPEAGLLGGAAGRPGPGRDGAVGRPSRERNQAKVERLRRWLVRLVERGRLPPVDRAAAGDTLARLGDPRFDPNAFWLPHRFRGEPEPLLGFLPVPAGTFQMGKSGGDLSLMSDEKPGSSRGRSLGRYGIYIARYPVTEAQFRAFVEASGFQPGDPDCLRDARQPPRGAGNLARGAGLLRLAGGGAALPGGPAARTGRRPAGPGLDGAIADRGRVGKGRSRRATVGSTPGATSLTRTGANYVESGHR